MRTYFVDNANGNDGGDGHDGSTEALAWASLSYAADQVVAGDTVYVQSGTEYTAADGLNSCVLYIDELGTLTTPITWIGYTTTIADGGKAVINAATNSLVNGISGITTTWGYNVFKNFEVKGASAAGINVGGTGGDYASFENCSIHNNGGWGVQGDNNITFLNCQVYSNAGGGIDVDSAAIIIGCTVYSNTGDGIVTSGISIIEKNIVYANTARQIYVNSPTANSIIANNTIDGDDGPTTIGISELVAAPSLGFFYNNVIIDCNTGVFFNTSCSYRFFQFNSIYSCNTASTNLAGDVGTLTSDPLFTNIDTRDYTLTSSSPLINAGLDGHDIGAEPYTSTGGSVVIAPANQLIY